MQCYETELYDYNNDYMRWDGTPCNHYIDEQDTKCLLQHSLFVIRWMLLQRNAVPAVSEMGGRL